MLSLAPRVLFLLGLANVVCLTEGSSAYNCYGDVTRIRPTGASRSTASQDRLSYSGVRASQQLVRADLSELNAKKSCYEDAGRLNCIHPALIAAIASRESRGGRLLVSTNGWGDNGNGWGLMQCDGSSGLSCTSCGWNSCCHIKMMTRFLKDDCILAVKRKHPRWTKEQQLQGGVAAYNFGVRNVQTVAGTDQGTTGNDYSNDVVARAQWLINNEGW